MIYVRTQYATGSQQYQVVPVTERYRPQQQDKGGNRDSNRKVQVGTVAENDTPFSCQREDPGIKRQLRCGLLSLDL
jgi:hypothetical protein